MEISMDDLRSFQTESDGFPRRSFILYVLSTVTTATAGRTAASSVQAILPSVIIVAVIGRPGRIVVGISRLSAVIGVARVTANGDQADIARAGVAVRPIAVTAAVAAVVVPPIPTVVPPVPVVIATTATTAVRIGNADIAVAVATNALEAEVTAVIATGVATAAITAQQIEKAVATAIATTAATTAGETVRITSIAHSILILLVYLRGNLTI